VLLVAEGFTAAQENQFAWLRGPQSEFYNQPEVPMAGDIATLQALVAETSPLIQQMSIAPILCMSDAQGYFSLADSWISSPVASIVPFKNQQQQLDDLIDQMAPPPPADALPEGQVVQLFIQASTGGSSTDLISALGELEKLSWPSRFQALQDLGGQAPSLDGQSYLEIIEGAAAQLPNTNAALVAAMIVVLMAQGGRTLATVDVAVKFMQVLPALGERDQWQLLSELGLNSLAIEGTMAALTGQAIAVGMVQLAPELLSILTGAMGATPIGQWNQPGNMPGGFYIGLAAHEAIAAEYKVANPPPAHTVFSNITPVGTILSQLQGQLMFKGNRVAVALGLSKPDIFDFSYTHPAGPPGWVYEIKPWNSLATAEYEALFYADALILAGIPAMPGLVGTPGTFGCLPAPGGWFAFSALAPGAIVYWYRKATAQELQAHGLAPADDHVEQETLAALKAASAAASVVAAAGVLAVIFKALMDAGWTLAFLAAAG
jgi:hypothetical protein